MSSGKVIVIEMKLIMSDTGQVKEFLNNSLFSWIAYNKNEPKKEFVLFDNYYKAPHFHIDQKNNRSFFNWVSEEQSQALFLAKVKERFGDFLQIKKIIKVKLK